MPRVTSGALCGMLESLLWLNASPASTYDATLSRCADVTSGPMSESRVPSPIRRVAVRAAIFSTSSSPIGPTATTTLIAMQRSPAEP